MTTDAPSEPVFPHLNHAIELDVDADVESWRLGVPGRGACYVLEDGDGRPVLLATVGGLRAAVVRRMTESDADGPSRRVDYRAVVRRVRWRPVFSPFEANWCYLENVRLMFPESYRRLIRRWRCHWVCVDANAEHPRFTLASRPGQITGQAFGPIQEARAARQLVESVEDLFDLCRYHEVLVQSPHGAACAYKEMGKCPAPCNGSVTMDGYRRQVAAGIAFLTEPREQWFRAIEQQMTEAADALAFERANRFKSMLDRARVIDIPAMAFLAPLERFGYLSLQPGQRKGRARAFVVTPGRITFMGEILPKQRDEQLQWLVDQASRIAAQPRPELGDAALERMALVGWHLFRGDRDPGVFLSIDQELTPAIVADAVERINEKPGDRTEIEPPALDAMSSDSDTSDD